MTGVGVCGCVRARIRECRKESVDRRPLANCCIADVIQRASFFLPALLQGNQQVSCSLPAVQVSEPPCISLYKNKEPCLKVMSGEREGEI